MPPRRDADLSCVGDDDTVDTGLTVGGDDAGWLIVCSDIGDIEVGAGETGDSVGCAVTGALLGRVVGALVVDALEGAAVVGLAVGALVWIAPTRSA